VLPHRTYLSCQFLSHPHDYLCHVCLPLLGFQLHQTRNHTCCCCMFFPCVIPGYVWLYYLPRRYT
jgi:hypothetical protein